MQRRNLLEHGPLRGRWCASAVASGHQNLGEMGKGEATKKGEIMEGSVAHRKHRKGMPRLTYKMATLTLLWRQGQVRHYVGDRWSEILGVQAELLLMEE